MCCSGGARCCIRKLQRWLHVSAPRSRKACESRWTSPRRIQFRGNLEFVADPFPPRHRVSGWWVGWQKSEGIANLDRATRESPARGEVLRGFWKRTRIVVGAYLEVIIPRRRTIKSTEEGNRQSARCAFATFSRCYWRGEKNFECAI